MHNVAAKSVHARHDCAGAQHRCICPRRAVRTGRGQHLGRKHHRRQPGPSIQPDGMGHHRHSVCRCRIAARPVADAFGAGARSPGLAGRRSTSSSARHLRPYRWRVQACSSHLRLTRERSPRDDAVDDCHSRGAHPQSCRSRLRGAVASARLAAASRPLSGGQASLSARSRRSGTCRSRSALAFACYTVALRLARLDGLHAAAISAVGSMFLFLPPYTLMAGLSMFDAPLGAIGLQALVQGLLTAVISYIVYGRAGRAFWARRVAQPLPLHVQQ